MDEVEGLGEAGDEHVEQQEDDDHSEDGHQDPRERRHRVHLVVVHLGGRVSSQMYMDIDT